MVKALIVQDDPPWLNMAVYRRYAQVYQRFCPCEYRFQKAKQNPDTKTGCDHRPMTATTRTDRCSRACTDQVRILLGAEEAQPPPSVAQSVVPRPPVSMTTTEIKLMAGTVHQFRAARMRTETRTGQ